MVSIEKGIGEKAANVADTPNACKSRRAHLLFLFSGDKTRFATWVTG
jgi:hypothetical protein